MKSFEQLRIIGVDPSLADSGICLLEGSNILQTTHISTSPSQTMPKRLHKIYLGFESFFQQAQADYLAIEDQFLGSFYTAKAHGIQERKNLKTIQGLSYVKGLAMTLAGQYDIPVIPINVSQWRTRYLPRRNMTKSEILKYINNLFQQSLNNHNISDSILVGLCGQALLKEQVLTQKIPPSASSKNNALTKRPIL